MARWKFIFMHAGKGYAQDHCSSFAAAIAYYALLSLFPLAVFAVTLAGYFLFARDPANQDRVIDGLMKELPLSPDARNDLRDTVAGIARVRGGLGLAGLLGAAYSASALFGALRTALNTVFRVERNRPLVQGKLLDLGMVFGLGTLLVLSLGLTATLTIVRRFSENWFGDFAVLVDVLATVANFVLPPMVSVVVFAVLYKVVPHAELNWRDALPGAALAAVGFEVLKLGFAQYVARFANYNAVYGTLGFVIVFLFFAYLSAQIVLFGAQFTRAYVEVATGVVPAAKPAVPKRPVSLPQRVVAMVKGLFVAPEPHHEEGLPYAPAKEGGNLSDKQAKQRR